MLISQGSISHRFTPWADLWTDAHHPQAMGAIVANGIPLVATAPDPSRGHSGGSGSRRRRYARSRSGSAIAISSGLSRLRTSRRTDETLRCRTLLPGAGAG
jgi:hypothetical protein